MMPRFQYEQVIMHPPLFVKPIWTNLSLIRHYIDFQWKPNRFPCRAAKVRYSHNQIPGNRFTSQNRRKKKWCMKRSLQIYAWHHLQSVTHVVKPLGVQPQPPHLHDVSNEIGQLYWPVTCCWVHLSLWLRQSILRLLINNRGPHPDKATLARAICGVWQIWRHTVKSILIALLLTEW